jgi:nicotinate-nucleotide adenylyltransferase
MKIGLFGGSFDPIHYGHIHPVREAAVELGLERVIYLPTAVPPHKLAREFAPARARFTMVELALLDEENFYASPFEMASDQPAFTIDSVEHFRGLYPEAELHVILGADNLAELTEWRRWQDLTEEAWLAVLVRPDWRLSCPPSSGSSPEASGYDSSPIARWTFRRPIYVGSWAPGTSLRRGSCRLWC